MHRQRTALALAVLVLGAATAMADVDLTKVERRIAKEPTYQSKTPKYCLLVFGPEAATRVWLVLDGDTLYIDRNGNGDLTDDGEKVKFEKPKDGERNAGIHVEAGTITAKEGVAPNTKVELMFYGPKTYVVCQAEGKGWQRAAGDGSGDLTFADRPADAPIIHFGGPLSLAADEPYTLQRGDKPTEFYTFLGTPGLGKGTFACISYENVGKDVHPVAEFTFPAKGGGAPLPPVKVVLSQRC